MANMEFDSSVVAASSDRWLVGRRLLIFFEGLARLDFRGLAGALIAETAVRLNGPGALADTVYENGLASACPPLIVDCEAGTLVKEVSVPLLPGGRSICSDAADCECSSLDLRFCSSCCCLSCAILARSCRDC